MSWVLFFDGDCAFCSKSVRQAHRWDKRRRLFFAPLQGKLSHELGFSEYASSEGGTMVVLRESDGKMFTRSDAWIEIARALGGPWKWLTVTRFIPKFLRDWVYNRVANNRHRFVKKGEACELPTPELQARIRE
ncbi:MAG: DCC1-like thiol-disulfide oxidoreductase family protein [Luteolibacter sp.]